jgi:ketosteroid isomerase-like protein
MNGTPLDAIRNLTDAWMKKDAPAMAHWLTEDILEIGPAFDTALSGQKQFFRKYRQHLRGPLEILSYRIIAPRTVMLNARLALVHFRYRMRTRSGRTTESSCGKESMLVQRRGRQWRVRYIHWHRDP